MTRFCKSDRQELNISGLPAPLSHYTDAVSFGKLLFVSGLTAHDSEGRLVGDGDPVKQTEQIFHNLQKVLQEVDATPAQILKVTVFLTNIEDRARINPVRQKFFGVSKPASTLVEVSRLAVPGMLVEIEAIVGLS